MGNWKGISTGSGWTGRQKSGSIRGPNWITDNGYMEVNREWAGHRGTGLEQHDSPRTNWF